jgi:uncharacterized protein
MKKKRNTNHKNIRVILIINHKESMASGYGLFPIHPQAKSIEGERYYPSLNALPEPVDGVLTIVPLAETERGMREAAVASIHRVWMQHAESEAAIRFCKDNGISVVHGECVLMFTEPVRAYHRIHRWAWG